MENTVDLSHPAIDCVNSQHKLYGINRYRCSRVTCPSCHRQRWLVTAALRRELLRPTWDGHCKSCLQKQPHKRPGIPSHPAIDASRAERRMIYGNVTWAAPTVCSSCGAERWYPVRTLVKWVKSPGYSGLCKPCATPKMRKSWQEMLRRKPRAAVHVTERGYRAVPMHAVPDEHQWLWKTLRRTGNTVLEHRIVYSIFLGRALRSDECVDHMNGDKLDNRLENLRLYLKGNNQPGSCAGSGTYYDEWQRAEARIRQLESLAR